jgi:hypothetical protein
MNIAEKLGMLQETLVAEKAASARQAGDEEYDSWFVPPAGELEYQSWFASC